MPTLTDWTAAVATELGMAGDDYSNLDRELDRNLVLDLARDVAHGVARPAAPWTTFLVGLAVGRSGGDPDTVRELARRVRELAGQWPGGTLAD